MGASGEPVDTDGDGIPNVEWPEMPAEEYEDVAAPDYMSEAWAANIKAMYDSWQSDSQQQARQRQSLQDKLNEQHLRFVEDQHTLLMRTADANALLNHRAANNAATIDFLIAAGETNATAQDVAGMKLSEEFRSVAKQAVEAAVAAVPGTSAASQGATGVAQGALQTQAPIELAAVLNNNISVQTALLATLADLNATVKMLAAARAA